MEEENVHDKLLELKKLRKTSQGSLEMAWRPIDRIQTGSQVV